MNNLTQRTIKRLVKTRKEDLCILEERNAEKVRKAACLNLEQDQKAEQDLKLGEEDIIAKYIFKHIIYIYMRGGKAIVGSIYNIPLKPPGGVGSPGGPGTPDKGNGDDDKGSGDNDDKSPPKDGIGDDGGMKGNCSFYDASAPHAIVGSQPIATENDECSLITGEGPPGTYGEGSGNKGIMSWGGRKSRRKKKSRKSRNKKRSTKKSKRKSKKRIRKRSYRKKR